MEMMKGSGILKCGLLNLIFVKNRAYRVLKPSLLFTKWAMAHVGRGRFFAVLEKMS